MSPHHLSSVTFNSWVTFFIFPCRLRKRDDFTRNIAANIRDDCLWGCMILCRWWFVYLTVNSKMYLYCCKCSRVCQLFSNMGICKGGGVPFCTWLSDLDKLNLFVKGYGVWMTSTGVEHSGIGPSCSSGHGNSEGVRVWILVMPWIGGDLERTTSSTSGRLFVSCAVCLLVECWNYYCWNWWQMSYIWWK